MKRLLFHFRTRGLRKTVGLSMAHATRRLPFLQRLTRRRSTVSNDDILMAICILQKEIRDLRERIEPPQDGRK
jgi:hypothetical protein